MYQRGGKRCFDIVLALMLLPIIALIICVIGLVSGANLRTFLFGHHRVGQNGIGFRCWKIRTMSAKSSQTLAAYLAANPDAANEWARTQKLTNDPRVTRFGHLLRRTSLDELPQIWNVLRGEMSFVGPRPVTSGELDHYGTFIWDYLSVRPGITGIWQVYGRANGCYQERVKMDAVYCRAISAYQDLKLIVMTAFTIFQVTGK